MPNRHKPPRRPQSSARLLDRAAQGEVLLATRQSAQFVAELRQMVADQLPESLRSHLAAVALRPGELVLFVDGAAWASRLKLLLAEWQPVLGAQVPAGTQLSVKVMPTGQLRR